MADTKTGYEGKIEKLADDLLCELDTLEQASSVVNIGLTPDDIRKAFKEMIARAFPDRPTVRWIIKYEYLFGGDWYSAKIEDSLPETHNRRMEEFKQNALDGVVRNITVTELCEKS